MTNRESVLDVKFRTQQFTKLQEEKKRRKTLTIIWYYFVLPICFFTRMGKGRYLDVFLFDRV